MQPNHAYIGYYDYSFICMHVRTEINSRTENNPFFILIQIRPYIRHKIP